MDGYDNEHRGVDNAHSRRSENPRVQAENRNLGQRVTGHVAENAEI